MKRYTYLSILGLGLLLGSVNAEARGGGHFHGGWHGGGHHWNGGGHHWGGGRVYHGNYGHRGYYSNNYYGTGYYGTGYGGWGYGWPGYYTGGPVGYYSTSIATRCVNKRVCNKRHICHYERFCPRY
jgi:hypothetical protein